MGREPKREKEFELLERPKKSVASHPRNTWGRHAAAGTRGTLETESFVLERSTDRLENSNLGDEEELREATKWGATEGRSWRGQLQPHIKVILA